jgi:hypothetical protein
VRSREAFACPRGRVEIRHHVGGGREVLLAPFDMLDVPVGIDRDDACAADPR